jgi:LacI family gluconate utilization system Gnt-I transcriptional repressor
MYHPDRHRPHRQYAAQPAAGAASPVVETWDMTASPIDMVIGFSHEEVGHATATHLLERGRRRFAILTASDPRAARRNQGLASGAGQTGHCRGGGSRIMAAAAGLDLPLGREGAARLLQAHAGTWTRSSAVRTRWRMAR